MITKIGLGLATNQKLSFKNNKNDTESSLLRTYAPVPANIVNHKFNARVPDILKQNFLATQQMQKVNDKGDTIVPRFVITTKTNKVRDVYIGDSKDAKITISQNEGVPKEQFPQGDVLVGKFGPTYEFIDKELGLKIQLLAGSMAKIGDILEVKNSLPVSKPVLPEKNEKVAFGGSLKDTVNNTNPSLQVVAFHNGEQVLNSTVEYMEHCNNERTNLISKADKQNLPMYNGLKPNVLVLAGGFGTRLENVTGENIPKPAAKLPTKDAYRLMGNALDAASSFNLKKENLEFLCGKKMDGANTGDAVTYMVEQKNDLGDGGCIAKSVFYKTTSTDAPLIVLNADTFTNADITKAYQKFLELDDDSAVMIPYYAASEDRASGFGLISTQETKVSKQDEKADIKKSDCQVADFYEPDTSIGLVADNCADSETISVDEDNNKKNNLIVNEKRANNVKTISGKEENIPPQRIVSFIEKPKKPAKEAEGAKVVDGQNVRYMANPGIYIIGPKALERLGKLYSEEKEKQKESGKEEPFIGLAKNFIEPLVRGELNDGDNKFKAYTVQLTDADDKPAYWDDLGTDVAFYSTFIKMAQNSSQFDGMPDHLTRHVKENVDLKSGRLYMDETARQKYDKFCEKYPGFEATGRVIVSSIESKEVQK